MSDEPQFDPDICIHAGELRAMGASIPDTIPDIGWVPRSAIQWSGEDPNFTMNDDGVFTGNLRCVVTQPFRWIEVDVTITKDGEVINNSSC